MMPRVLILCFITVQLFICYKQIQQEEFYLQLLQEKDNEYNALVKKLKDRVIHLEQELQETQRKTGLPIYLPYDSASLRLTPQMTRKQPPKRFQKSGKYNV